MKTLLLLIVILMSVNISTAYSQLPPGRIDFHSYGIAPDAVNRFYDPMTAAKSRFYFHDTIPYTLYISCELKGDTLYIPDGVQYMLIDGQIYRMRRKTTITFEGIRVFDDQIKAETFWEQYQKRLGILNDSPITVTPEYFTRPATGEAVKRDTTTPYPYKYFKPAVHRLKNKNK